MLIEYIPLIIMVIFGFAMGIVFLFASEWLGARRKTKEKHTTYESGMVSFGTAREKFSVKYYMIAMSFIIFDIEIVFMYPWAVNFSGFHGTVPHITVLIFILILFIGYYWELKRGGFKWD